MISKSAATNIDYLMKKNNHNILMVTSYRTGEGKNKFFNKFIFDISKLK